MCGIPEGPVIKTESTGVGKGALFLPEIYFQQIIYSICGLICISNNSLFLLVTKSSKLF